MRTCGFSRLSAVPTPRSDADVPTQPGAPTSDLVQHHPAGAAKYAIELSAGEADALGINVGDALEFDEGSD